MVAPMTPGNPIDCTKIIDRTAFITAATMPHNNCVRRNPNAQFKHDRHSAQTLITLQVAIPMKSRKGI